MRPLPLLNLLHSVKEQVLYPDEILIIDGSTNDQTKRVISQNSFINLKYYKVGENNRGLTKQRNFGIDLVDKSIDIVCFLDDDIILYKDYFKALMSTYSMYPDALAVGGYIINEVTWERSNKKANASEFKYDGWLRTEGKRFVLRKKLGLLDETAPGFMPSFSNGRSTSFLPPNNKIYPTEMLMGGVSSYRKSVFSSLSFSTYFEGYGLYEDADFSLRLSKKGKLYINTAAQLEHHHNASGRPKHFKYGKMVVRNGWYVWRVKYEKPSLKARLKWNAISFLLTFIRLSNVLNSNKSNGALKESLGRFVGLISLIYNRPKIQS